MNELSAAEMRGEIIRAICGEQVEIVGRSIDGRVWDQLLAAFERGTVDPSQVHVSNCRIANNSWLFSSYLLAPP